MDGREGRVAPLTAAEAGAGDALVLQALGGDAAQRARLQAPVPGAPGESRGPPPSLPPSWSQHSDSTLPLAAWARQGDTVTYSRRDAGTGVRARQECSLQHTDKQRRGLQSGLLQAPALDPSS